MAAVAADATDGRPADRNAGRTAKPGSAPPAGHAVDRPPPHRALGLTDAEFDLIVERLGREPNGVELAMFSLMWSEHCSYKHSKKLLAKLPTEGPHVVMGPGENAGAVDVGDGLVVAFKVESHNHPSAVEPFQGAATGVGGILRDVFAIGARPIAVLDSLRFGELDSPRSRYLLEQAVAGIGHYGNSIGVPTVGGEIYFEGPYEQNCLINAMCVGLADRDKLIRSAAVGAGNLIVLYGALTGRDGIGGASVLASAELSEDDAAKRPSVQIGDPFAESKLLECSLELLEQGLLSSLQDLGAAGLTSSASEMASKGELGIELDVDLVPLREPGMEPFEIMVSESQERMLCVVEPARLDAVIAICAKWDTPAAVIGRVTDDGRMRVLDRGETVANVAVGDLVDECPLYDLAPTAPDAPLYPTPPRRLDPAADPVAQLLALVGSDNIASRRHAFEQYDCLVGSRTIRRPEQAEAAVLRLGADGPSIAISIDGNGRRVAADPYRGTIEAVLECAANLACVGAVPLGLTNCLNFGNPEKPHVAWQLEQSVAGMAAACRAIDAPVVGGNVSLYNESGDGPIYPTPVVGIVGRLDDPSRAAGNVFTEGGMTVALIGPFRPDLAASEFAKLTGEPLPDRLPDLDLGLHARSLALVREAVRDGVVTVARDISAGGLATCLAKCTLGGVGAELDLAGLFHRERAVEIDLRTALFGEGPGGVVVCGERDALLALSDRARGVGFLVLGATVDGARGDGETGDGLANDSGGGMSSGATAANSLQIHSPTGTLRVEVDRIRLAHGAALADRLA